MPENLVAITRCPSYEGDELKRAIRDVLTACGAGRGLFSGRRVLLKPNLIVPADPEICATTHPAFVEAVASILWDMGAREILLGDSPGDSYGNLDYLWKKTGMKEVCERLSIKLVVFEKESFDAPIPSPPANPRFQTLKLTAAVRDVDVIVNLPKFKTHSFTKITGAIKNLYGTVPGFVKKRYHKELPHPRDFSRLIVDVARTVRGVVGNMVCLMDGIWGMEGEGPHAGKPRKVGIVMGSLSPFAMDLAMAKIMGYENPREIYQLEAAAELGLLGGPTYPLLCPDDVKVTNFEKAYTTGSFVENANPLLFRVASLMGKLVDIKPVLLRERCTGCGVCARNCPVSAITIVGRKAKIDYRTCIRCFTCHEVCPNKAYELRKNLWWRVFNGITNLLQGDREHALKDWGK